MFTWRRCDKFDDSLSLPKFCAVGSNLLRSIILDLIESHFSEIPDLRIIDLFKPILTQLNLT